MNLEVRESCEVNRTDTLVLVLNLVQIPVLRLVSLILFHVHVHVLRLTRVTCLRVRRGIVDNNFPSLLNSTFAYLIRISTHYSIVTLSSWSADPVQESDSSWIKSRNAYLVTGPHLDNSAPHAHPFGSNPTTTALKFLRSSDASFTFVTLSSADLSSSTQNVTANFSTLWRCWTIVVQFPWMFFLSCVRDYCPLRGPILECHVVWNLAHSVLMFSRTFINSVLSLCLIHTLQYPPNFRSSLLWDWNPSPWSSVTSVLKLYGAPSSVTGATYPGVIMRLCWTLSVLHNTPPIH